MYEALPNVSIIILTYNGENYIETLLNSLIVQSYPKDRMEIIVIDNASTDQTVRVVQNQFSQVKCITLQENLGFAGGNNKALKYAKHGLMVFLNQDTICHRDWLKALVKGMLQNKTIAACSSNIVPCNPDDFKKVDLLSKLDAIYFCDLSPFGYGRFYRRYKTPYVFTKILSGCSFAIHRKTVNELGYLFDDKFWMYSEDTDLSLRIHNIGRQTCVVRDSIVYHYHHNDFQINKKKIYLSASAIMNRVCAFFKNMSLLEFVLFFPILVFGSVFKIFEFPISPFRKALYLIPFGLFSNLCSLLALPMLPGFVKKRRNILNNRQVIGLPILKLVLKHHH